MNTRALVIYFVILAVLVSGLVAVARISGQIAYVQGYMLTPAVAAIITRSFFYNPRFRDANLRFGRARDYIKFWAWSLGIMVLSYGLYTLLGAIRWDFSGNVFLERLAQQFAATGQDMNASLPPGFTPQMMLLIFFVGGLTVFNILPGIVTGFGEEFGHRGFMFPLLYQINPWVGIVGGGLIWWAWHLPLMLVIPQPAIPLWQTVLNLPLAAIGSICTFTYLAYIYVKSESVFVTAIAHIAMNNAAQSLSYFVVLQDQFMANVGQNLALVIVFAILYYRKEFDIFGRYFRGERRFSIPPGQLKAEPRSSVVNG